MIIDSSGNVSTVANPTAAQLETTRQQLSTIHSNASVAASNASAALSAANSKATLNDVKTGIFEVTDDAGMAATIEDLSFSHTTNGYIINLCVKNSKGIGYCGLMAYMVKGDNAASATKLLTPRTLWGRSFDGTANVTGDLTSVGAITPTSDVASDIGTLSKKFKDIYAKAVYVVNGTSLTATCTRLLYGGIELYHSTPFIDFHNSKASKDANYSVRLMEETMGTLKCFGGFTVTGTITGTLAGSSDRRLKKQVRDFNASELIGKLHPKAFKWNAKARRRFKELDTDETQYGLIAQETREVAPWLVSDDILAKDYLGVNYSKLIPVLLQGLKEQTDRIDQLQQQLVAMKKEMAELRRK